MAGRGADLMALGLSAADYATRTGFPTQPSSPVAGWHGSNKVALKKASRGGREALEGLRISTPSSPVAQRRAPSLALSRVDLVRARAELMTVNDMITRPAVAYRARSKAADSDREAAEFIAYSPRQAKALERALTGSISGEHGDGQSKARIAG